MKTIHLAVVDDEALFRKGLVHLIQGFSGMDLVLEAQNGLDLLNQLNQADTLPHVVLLDLKMPEMNGVETAKVLRADYPNLRVVVLSTYFSRSFVLNMLEIGAAAYLSKNTEPREVENTIHLVVEKGFYYSDPVMEIVRDKLLRSYRKSQADFGLQLTAREQEVLQLICEQFTTSEIAEKLYISTRTVEGHRNSLLQKFNCRNTAGLVAFAYQYKLVTTDPSQLWGE
jgi:DNA-binding NarL/FixJ family response regulator